MKEYLNRYEDEKGNIVVKMVKMGMDIDEDNNYRIRGIVPTDDNKYLFVELTAGHRFEFNKSNFPYMTKQTYNEKYPNEMYVYCDSCFRVDIPEDYYHNYTNEFIDYDRKPFYKLNYDKDSVLAFLKQFNKNITGIELVDKNYIDEYCDSMGFYRLYDERLEHKYEPISVVRKNSKNIIFNMKYTCKNYNKTVEYSEERQHAYKDFNLDKIKKEFGEELVTNVIEEYDNSIENMFANKSDNLQI